MPRLLRIISLICIALISGCSMDRVTWPEPRPLGADLKVNRPAEKPYLLPSVQGEIEEPKDALSLRQALALALLRNPELAAFSLEVRAREAKTLQSSLLPNPTLGFDVENVLGTGTRQGLRQAEYTIQVSQIIELGGKRSARTLEARRETLVAGWEYEAKRIEILTRVGSAFINVLREQEKLVVTDEMMRSADAILKAVGERVLAGKASPVEEIKAKISLSSAKIEHDRTARLLAAAKAGLAALWGSKVPLFASVKGDLKIIAVPPPLEDLNKRISQNPEALRQQAEILRSEATLKVEKSKTIPDLTLGGGYRNFADGNDGAFVFGLSVPLPLFDRNQGGIREAQHRIAKAHEEQRSTDVRITTALASAYHGLLAAHTEVADLEKNVLPRSQEVFVAVEDGYKAGKFGYLELLDARQTMYTTRLQYLRAAGDYHQAVTQVEQLIGEPLFGLSGEPGEQRGKAETDSIQEKK